MFRLHRPQLQPIGVDIGADAVKLLQLDTSGDIARVHAAARLPLPELSRQDIGARLDAATALIRPALKSGQFNGRRVIATLPPEFVQIKTHRIAADGQQPLDAAVLAEAASLFPFNLAGYSLRFVHAGRVRQGERSFDEVMIAAASDADVTRFLGAMSAAGAVVQSLEIQPLAAYRAIAHIADEAPDSTLVRMLVDVGTRSTQVVIGKGDQVRFFKSIAIGSWHLHEAISRRLGVTAPEAQQLRRRLTTSATQSERPDPVAKAVSDATRQQLGELAREIALCAQYDCVTFRGPRPSRVSLLGGESDDLSLQRVLTDALGIPAGPERIAALMDSPRVTAPERSDVVGGWAVAYGLALKPLSHARSARSEMSASPETMNLNPFRAEVASA